MSRHKVAGILVIWMIAVVLPPAGCVRESSQLPAQAGGGDGTQQVVGAEIPMVMQTAVTQSDDKFMLNTTLRNVADESLYVWGRSDQQDLALRYYAGAFKLLVFRGAALKPRDVDDGPDQSFWVKRLQPGETLRVDQVLARPLEEAPFFRSLWQDVEGLGERPEQVFVRRIVVMQGFWRESVVSPLLVRLGHDADDARLQSEAEWATQLFCQNSCRTQ